MDFLALNTTEVLSLAAAAAATVAALSTVVYTVITLRLLRRSTESIELTQRAIFLNALASEAELYFATTELNPDGTLRLGADSAPPRVEVWAYITKIRTIRGELEARVPSLRSGDTSRLSGPIR